MKLKVIEKIIFLTCLKIIMIMRVKKVKIEAPYSHTNLTELKNLYEYINYKGKVISTRVLGPNYR